MDKTLTSCPGNVVCGDTNESILNLQAGVITTREIPLWITVVSGSISFNINGPAALGATYTTGMSFPITIIPGANDLRFKGSSPADNFNISVYS